MKSRSDVSDQAQASRERFGHFAERDVALLKWRFGCGYMAELERGRYQRMFAGARRILDVGCGLGEAARWANGADYFGVDLSEVLVRKGQNQPDRILAVASADALPFPNETFDRVTCMGLLHHLSRNQIPLTLKEMTRVLKIGGALVLVEANPWSLCARMMAYVRPAERGILNTSPAHLRWVIESLRVLTIEEIDYDHTMFWPSYGTFLLRRWSWPTGPRMTAWLLALHRWVTRLTPGPLRFQTFWRIRKHAEGETVSSTSGRQKEREEEAC
ncbi:MAG TPA: class I SAM-dependent methyltransferase [Thermodesulfobacteriota bacterium]|nr:class I SAM-dependent methyltransferase [Thermodesulfobacteriota bacterium]